LRNITEQSEAASVDEEAATGFPGTLVKIIEGGYFSREGKKHNFTKLYKKYLCCSCGKNFNFDTFCTVYMQ
jgi:hypothetical protein